MTGTDEPIKVQAPWAGTIGGSAVYTLAGPVQFTFDGTSLS